MQNKLVGKTVVGAKSVVTCDSGIAKPEIDVRMNGDRVESVVITCGCGETHTIVCEYASDQ